MNRDSYLASHSVREFLVWLEPHLCSAGAFRHEYNRARGGHWSCASLFDAYEKYDWRFRTMLPDGEVIEGRTFDESYRVLARLQTALHFAEQQGNSDLFLDAAIGVLKWGGVIARNEARLRALGSDALPVMTSAARQLEPSTADTDSLGAVQLMNAGFTKVYSLMVPGLPIYDGRVGAALGYLVRLYCEEVGARDVPLELQFAWGAPKETGRGHRKNRNPSTSRFHLPKLRPDPRQHARCNLMAAWLLNEASRSGYFGGLRSDRQLRALEAALFMVGYDIPKETPFRTAAAGA